MALRASEIYKLTAEELRDLCSEEGLDSAGPVRLLRQRLVDHLTTSMMGSKQDTETEQASVRTDLSLDATHGGAQNPTNGSHVGGGDNTVPVVVELLRKVPPLSSEEPEAILRLVGKLDEIYSLGLTDDRNFVVRILPLFSGAVMRFFGDCLRSGRNWEQCKGELLKEFFPHFVRERLKRDHIVFNFHEEGQSLREYVDRVFTAARFLQYEAEEEQLIDRIVMNLHPTILAHAAFLDRPRSRQELITAVGLIEEKFSVLRERQRTQPAVGTVRGSGPRNQEPSRNVPPTPRPPRCWDCGRVGHVRRYCRQRVSHSGNGRAPGGPQGPGRQQ